jgi:hypothetical protein
LDNPGIILNQIAEFSAAFEEELTHDSNTTDINYSYYVTIASACLPYSQKMTAAVLNRFFEDVTNSSRRISYIKNDSVYFIQNVGSGNYIDVKSWSTLNNAITRPFSFHGDTNQQFRAEIQSDGSFMFVPMHDTTKKMKIYMSNTSQKDFSISNNGYKFRVVYYKNSQYRIIPEYNGAVFDQVDEKYYKYPIYENSGKIGICTLMSAWTPSNTNFYWYFQEAPSINSGEVDTYLFKNEIKKILINVTTSGFYNIETTGNIDTKFTDLSYRIGTMNTNIYLMTNFVSDDDGTNYNAKYNNIYLETGRTYILTLRGYNSQTSGNIAIKLTNLENQWILYRTSSYDITDNGRFENNYDAINVSNLVGYNILQLKENGYNSLSISFKFSAYEENDGYQYVFLYNGYNENSTLLYEQMFEHVSGSQNSSSKEYCFSTIINLDLITSNYIYIRYGASGTGSDTWINYNLYVTIIAN